MGSFRHSDSLVKIIPLYLWNNLFNKEYFLSVQLFTILFSAFPLSWHSHSPPTSPTDTDPEHGAVQEHVSLVAHHAVLVQHGDPLLRELDGLRGATGREWGGADKGRDTPPTTAKAALQRVGPGLLPALGSRGLGWERIWHHLAVKSKAEEQNNSLEWGNRQITAFCFAQPWTEADVLFLRSPVAGAESLIWHGGGGVPVRQDPFCHEPLAELSEHASFLTF